jgi:hypothetical protein
MTTTTGCVTKDMTTGTIAVRATASGLTPDVDVVNVDFRIQAAISAAVKLDQTVNGTLTSASLESHVLACHLRSGAACAPADVAAIEAARPKPSYTGGTLRSHLQGFYFTCPQFLADTEGAITGVESIDAGMATDAGVGTASFAPIQEDIDFMGCATGGCHEQLTQPGQMHLYFRPSTPLQLRANYDAVLPWTHGAVDGGRFVNEVPLRTEMRARWLSWIADGTPF